MPTSTDLVTDLPADFEVFGQAVDTSLADLKGGTTGQILSKASATDMDFTWVANDVGDITAVTAGTGITGGGTSGAVTVSFDQANFGGGQWAAGKNKIINGDFGVWQRGTSFSTSAAYTADRWELLFDGSAATRAITQQTFTLGTAPVAGYEGTYFYRYNQSVAGSAATFNIVRNKMEDVQTFAGQTVTLSFWAKASATTTMDGIRFAQNFGSGGSGGVSTTAVEDPIFTTSWTRYTYTVAIPSITGKTIGTGSCLELRFLYPINSTFTVDIWGVQVEAASTASPFQTATGTKQGELAACQRYYYQPKGFTFFTAYAFSATLTYCSLPLPVTMRTTPSYTLTNADLRVSTPGGDLTPSASASVANSDSSIMFSLTQTYTAGRGALAFPATDTAIKISAEL